MKIKKSIIALIGLFSLVACSEDAFQSADETNGITATENTEPDRSVRTVTAGGYSSPWNINNLINVQYSFDSHVVNSSGYAIRITPYIGLAYYDGNDNGTYTPISGGTSYNLAGGAYPNLYANGHEYGSYVQANPIVLYNKPNPGAWYTHELWVVSNEDHCPLTNVPVGINYNLYSIGFDIVNNNIIQPSAFVGGTITPTPSAGTTAEERLLREFGKVMYYKVEYSNFITSPSAPLTFTNPAHYVLAREANDIGTFGSEWSIIPDPLFPTVPFEDTPFSGKLYFHDDSGAGTKEINVEPVAFPDPVKRQEASGVGFISAGYFHTITTHSSGATIHPPTGPDPGGVKILFH